MKSRHGKFLKLAANIAEAVPKVANAKIASIVVIRNEIISIGTCQYKTHPFQDKYKHHAEARYWHAETNAIFNALKKIDPIDLQKASLYVARVKNKNNEQVWGLAKPCSGCMHAIAQFGLKKVYYTTDSDEYQELL